MGENVNPGFITPPPGLLPAPPARTPAPESEAPGSGQQTAEPPTESATRRISPARIPVPARAPAASGIPFVPPPVASPAAAGAPSAGIDDDETIISAPVRPADPVWRLMLPDGQAVVVVGAIFVGRNPSRTVGDIDGELLAVADSTKSVSKTHALIEADDHGLWVTDLDSTNGVFLTSTTEDDEQAIPAVRTAVGADRDIELGEFVIRVESN